MKFKQIEIYVMSLFLLITAVYCGVQQSEETEHLAFLATTENGSEWIYPRILDDGAYQVFIPSYVNLEDLKVHTNHAIGIDGREYLAGMNCGMLEPGQIYPLTGMGEKTTIVFYQSANVPTMYIHTESGTMEYINASKENEEQGRMQLYTEDGKIDYQGALSTIKGRGQSTFENSTEKKPYSLKLREPADLLGMGMVFGSGENRHLASGGNSQS